MIKFDFLASTRFQKREIKIPRDRGEIKIKAAHVHFPLISLPLNKTALTLHPVKRESLSFHGCYVEVRNGFKM